MRLSHTRVVTLYKQQNGVCYYCGVDLYAEILAGRRIEIDHKRAIAKGGGNDMQNLCLVCANCNRSKGAKSEEEFIVYLKPFLDGVVDRRQLWGFHQRVSPEGISHIS